MNGLKLVIGNKNYSSWSMRPWLLLRQRGIEFEEVQIPLRQPDSLERKLAYSPAGKVPILIDGDLHIWESLAIVDYLAEKFPENQLWPQDREARATLEPCPPRCTRASRAFDWADAMFAPVASRFQTYGVELSREEAVRQGAAHDARGRGLDRGCPQRAVEDR